MDALMLWAMGMLPFSVIVGAMARIIYKLDIDEGLVFGFLLYIGVVTWIIVALYYLGILTALSQYIIFMLIEFAIAFDLLLVSIREEEKHE